MVKGLYMGIHPGSPTSTITEVTWWSEAHDVDVITYATPIAYQGRRAHFGDRLQRTIRRPHDISRFLQVISGFLPQRLTDKKVSVAFCKSVLLAASK